MCVGGAPNKARHCLKKLIYLQKLREFIEYWQNFSVLQILLVYFSLVDLLDYYTFIDTFWVHGSQFEQRVR